MQRKKILVSFLIVILASTLVSVVFGATFGQTSIVDYSEDSIGGAGYMGTRFQLTEDGTATKLTVYCGHDSGSANMKAAIYLDKAGPLPNTLKVGSSDVSVTGFAWYDFDIADTALTAGWYWLVLNVGANGKFYDDGGVSGNSFYDSETYGAWETPIADPTTATATMAIYCTYTPSGGGTSKTFQGNFAPTFTFGSTRTWQFQTYRTIPFSFVFDSVIKSSITGLTTLTFYGDILGTFALNHWNTYAFTSLHSFTMTFATSLNRFVNLNTINTFGFAFTLNQLRQWQFSTYRTIPFQFTLESISNLAYSLPRLLTFYGDITATFTVNALKDVGFTREQTIPFSFAIETATNLLQLGIITISSAIGFTFQLLNTQYGLAQLTLESIYAIAGLALILAISMPVAFFMLKRRKD